MKKFKELKLMTEEKKDKYDEGEYDQEGDMAKSDLRSIMANAKELHDMIDDADNLPEWCQNKITLAEDYISTVSNYMSSEIDESADDSKSELGDLAHETTLKHRFLVTYSDPNHTMVSKRKEKQQKHVLVPSTKNGETVYQGDAEPLVKKFMKKQGMKVHDVEHVGMVSKKVYEDTIDESTYRFEPATHKPTIRNSRGHSFEGNTYNAKGKKGASIYKHKDTGKYYADRISANTTFHDSAKEAAEKYHNKAK